MEIISALNGPDSKTKSFSTNSSGKRKREPWPSPQTTPRSGRDCVKLGSPLRYSVNGYAPVLFLPAPGLNSAQQAADRRDRLIYVLSQINAARGEDAMPVDDESSEESEEEVSSPYSPCLRYRRPCSLARRILYSRFFRAFGSSATYRGVLSPQVGITLSVIDIGKVLTRFLVISLSFRAQQRVAQQRLDSRMDLGRIVDIRKKAFAEVKVRQSTSFSGSEYSLASLGCLEILQPWFPNR